MITCGIGVFACALIKETLGTATAQAREARARPTLAHLAVPLTIQ